MQIFQVVLIRIGYNHKVLETVKHKISHRLIALDLIRGWCLIVIMADHLVRYPSVFDVLTGRGLLWVSAAEGFFFISGILVGTSRGREIISRGFKYSARKLLSRAGKLYLASIILCFIYASAGYWLQSNGVTTIKGGLIHFGSTFELVKNILLLQYNYGWADFLSYYVIFLLLSPIVLLALHHRLWWIVILAVFGVWISKTIIDLPFPFYYGIWQAYFFIGMVIGFYLPTIRKYYANINDKNRLLAAKFFVPLTIFTVITSFVFTFGTEFFERTDQTLLPLVHLLNLPNSDQLHMFFFNIKENETFKFMFQDDRTGILRLPIFILWFTSLFWIVHRYEFLVVQKAGWLLFPLGRNSLYVYIIQSFLAFIVPLLFIPNNFIANSLTIFVCIVICWVAVKNRFMFSIIPR